jgi:hypothetical protein
MASRKGGRDVHPESVDRRDVHPIRQVQAEVSSRPEDVKKSILKFAVKSAFKKIAPGCRISDRWDVGKHLGSKIKSRKHKEINFFTSSRPRVPHLTTNFRISRDGMASFI